MRDFFGFRSMVSSKLIQILYVIGMVMITLSGIEALTRGGILMILSGISVIVFGNLIWRIVCEIWILLFSIHDILASINRNILDMEHNS